MRFDRDAVLADLPQQMAHVTLDWFGVQARQSGRELRTRICPECGPRSRDSVSINRATCDWIDHAHGCRGDLFALVGGYAGLKTFGEMVALTASIAGISPNETDPERDRRIAERRRVDAKHERQAQAERAAVLATMPGRWESLDRRNDRGERYLVGRGIDPAELRACGDVVRYRPNGDPAVALRDLATGAIVGIQYRRLEGDAKLGCDAGSQLKGSALLGKPSDIDPDGTDVAVLVEGLADTLVARLAFPGCTVFGAPGWEHLGRIAAAIAPRIVAARGWLLVVPHVDGGVGETGCAQAVVAAMKAGLVLDNSIHLVDVRPHKDLAEAWASNWRWSWPS